MSNRALVQLQEPNDQFPFLKLPRELRIKIYRELLQTEEYLSLGGFPRVGLHLGILRACKQVHDEAVGVLYGENVFDALPNICPNRNGSRVRRARSYVQFYYNYMILGAFLDSHPDLTHLFLDFAEGALKKIPITVEKTLRRHRGLIDLEVRVRNPLSQDAIDFCWRLYSVVRRNRAAVGLDLRPEEAELHDTTACPSFVKVGMAARISNVSRPRKGIQLLYSDI
ncbi:hypothetical protein V8E54_008088 [Elaphomyces granulatus]|jgi:hypothetical protein